jgi:hypothetical protein
MLLVTAGLPSSHSLMSWGQFGMAAAWFLYGNWKLKAIRLFNIPATWSLPTIFLLFLVGMIHTSDVWMGWHTLKILLPLFIVPVMMATMPPLTLVQKSWIIHTLLAALWVCMGIGLIIYWIVPEGAMNDFRKLSPFISNVRFSTLLVIAIFISVYLFSSKGTSYRWMPAWIYLIVALGMLIYLFLLKSLTGLFVLSVLSIINLLYFLFLKRSPYAIFSVIILLILTITGILKLIINEYDRYHVVKDDFASLPLSTRYGSIYKHDTTRWEKENGYHVWINISWFELKREWNKRSSIDFDGTTSKGFLIRETLLHFLASKGLRKDADGVRALTDEEVKAIEHGIGNVNFMNQFSIRSRIYEIFKELDYYQRTGDASGKSLSARLEIWKHCLQNISYTPWTGVGTGDVLNTMYKSYADSNTSLHPVYWMNPHNQYLYTALAMGIPAAIFFLFMLVYPVFLHKGYLFINYWGVIMLAMLDEDTLITQAGVTQVAFLFSFFLLYFSYKRKSI